MPKWTLSLDWDETFVLQHVINETEYHYQLNSDLILFIWACSILEKIATLHINTHRTCLELATAETILEDKFFSERALSRILPILEKKYGIKIVSIITPYSAHYQPHPKLILAMENEIITLYENHIRDKRNEIFPDFTKKWQEKEEQFLAGKRNEYDEGNAAKQKQSSNFAKDCHNSILHLDDKVRIINELNGANQTPKDIRFAAVHFDKEDKEKKWLAKMVELIDLQSILDKFILELTKKPEKNWGLKELAKLVIVHLVGKAKIPINISDYFDKKITMNIKVGIKELLVQQKILPQLFFRPPSLWGRFANFFPGGAPSEPSMVTTEQQKNENPPDLAEIMTQAFTGSPSKKTASPTSQEKLPPSAQGSINDPPVGVSPEKMEQSFWGDW